MSISIGIDFGTSKTLVARVNPDNGHPTAIHLGRSRHEIPTTVYICEDDTLLFGDDADDNAQFDFSNYSRGFKLKLGSTSPLLIGPAKGYSAKDLTRAFLKHIKERCEKEAVLDKITSAVITVPAVFTPAQRADLQEAAKGAGFSTVELLPEPIAAGMAYCGISPKNAFEGSILVVDWGGGTLDLAIVSRGKDGHFEAIQGLVDGSSGIGGEAMDEATLGLVTELLAETGGIDIANEPIERRGTHLAAIRQAKELLSTREEHRVALLTTQGPKRVDVSRKQLDSAIMNHVREGSTKAFDLIEKARSKNHTPIFTLLVGGTCKIPLVKHEIELSTKTDCRVWEYSREAVAFGAAIKAASQTKPPQAVQDTASVMCPKCSKSMTVKHLADGQKIYSCACYQAPKPTPHQTDLPQTGEKDDGKYYCLKISGMIKSISMKRSELTPYSFTPGAMFCELGREDWKPAYLLDDISKREGSNKPEFVPHNARQPMFNCRGCGIAISQSSHQTMNGCCEPKNRS